MRSDDVIAARYRLVEVVGAGGTGTVWLADDLRQQRKVALKRPVAASPGLRADLEREAEIARKVAHPGAVEVLGVVGDGDDDCWLVTEYFAATSLAAKGILPPREVAAIGAQVAGALAAAHAADVVHRDVSPDNVLVADNGTTKVTSAWRAAASTAAYVAPEVADGDGATPESDMFSLGATLFAAVEGGPPFGTGDPEARLRRIRSGRGEIAIRSGALKPVLDALLQRDSAARPTAEEAKDLLGKVASGQTVPAWPGARRQPRVSLVAAAAVAVIAILLLGVVRPWQSDADSPVRTVLGNPRTADPCAVADPGVLSRFGETTMDADYGGFGRCDVLIAVAGDDMIDVRFQFDLAATRDAGGAQVVRHAPKRDSDACDIGLTLADQAVLSVAARSDDDLGADFCQVAAVAADHAESVLRQHKEIPRRTRVDARSLANVDACQLITAADLAAVPAYAGVSPEPGYGDWSCRWRSAAGALRVIFDRNELTGAGEGTRTERSGRDVYVLPDGYGDFTCSASVFHLRYEDPHGDEHVELALVVAEGGEAMADLCQVASAFAGPVAAHLPVL